MTQNNNSEPKKARRINKNKFFAFHIYKEFADDFVKSIGAKATDLTETIPFNGHFVVFDTPNQAFTGSKFTKNYPLSIRALKKAKGEYNFAVHDMFGKPRSAPVFAVKPDIKAALNVGLDGKMSKAENKFVASAEDVIFPVFEIVSSAGKYIVSDNKNTYEFEIDVINSSVSPYRKKNEEQSIESLVIVRQTKGNISELAGMKEIIENEYGFEISDVEDVDFAMRRYNSMVLKKGFDAAKPHIPVIEKSRLPAIVNNMHEIEEAPKSKHYVETPAAEEQAKSDLTARQEKIVEAVTKYITARSISYATLSQLHHNFGDRLGISPQVMRKEVLEIADKGKLDTNNFESNRVCVSLPSSLRLSKKDEAEENSAEISKRGKLMFGELVYQQHVLRDGDAVPLAEFAGIAVKNEILSMPATYANIDKLSDYIAKTPVNKKGFAISVKSMPADFETDYTSYGFDEEKLAAYKKSLETFKGEAKFICMSNRDYEDMKERLVRNAEKIADKGSVTCESNTSHAQFSAYPEGTLFNGKSAFVIKEGIYTPAQPHVVFNGVKEDDTIKFTAADAKGRKAELSIVCNATVSYTDDNSPYASRFIAVTQDGGKKSLLDAVIDYKTTSNHITHRLIDAVIKPADMPEPQIRGRKPALI